MTITKDLKAVSKKLTKLANQAEELAVAIGKTETSKVKPIQTKTKAKAVTKKAPPKVGKGTDTDKVLAIINRSKKGVDRKKSATCFTGLTNRGKSQEWIKDYTSVKNKIPTTH
jgi:hypothetical protein